MISEEIQSAQCCRSYLSLVCYDGLSSILKLQIISFGSRDTVDATMPSTGTVRPTVNHYAW